MLQEDHLVHTEQVADLAKITWDAYAAACHSSYIDFVMAPITTLVRVNERLRR